MPKFIFLAIFCFLILELSACGSYDQPIQPSRYQIENIDRNAGDNDDQSFPVDPSIRFDDESINPDIPQKYSPKR